MEDFNRLVSEQMSTMGQLLSLQAELEKQQELEKKLTAVEKEREQNDFKKQELELVQSNISIIKQELKAIQTTFTKQTKELIRVYQENSTRV